MHAHRHSPAYPPPESGTSSEGRSHHGHGSHGHKRDLKREQAALIKNQYVNPGLPGLAPVAPHSTPVPAGSSQQAHSAGFVSAPGTYQQQTTGTLASHSGAHVNRTDSSVALWGEAERGGRSTVGHKQPMRPLLCDGWKATSVTCSVPRLYQPPSISPLPIYTSGEPTSSVSTALELPRDGRGCNLILHSMDMKQDVAEMRHLVSVTASAQDIPGPDLQLTVPPIPTRFWTPPSREEEQQQQRRRTDALLGAPSPRLPKVYLDQTARYLLLRKSAAAIAAHVGYESSSSRTLDTLTDILGDFLSRIAKVMRTKADQMAEQGSVGFQDVLDRSLHECGIEGKAALQTFWQTSVKVPTHQLHHTAVELREEYQRMVDPLGETATGASGRSLSTTPGLLPLGLKASKGEVTDFRLLSPWLAGTPGYPLPGAAVEEEISLDSVMQHANLDNVASVKTPDLGGPVAFSQIGDTSGQESEGFTSLAIDGPPRKRLRTMSLSTD